MRTNPQPSLQSAAHSGMTWRVTGLLTCLMPLLISAGPVGASKRIKPKTNPPTTAPARRTLLYPPDKSVLGSNAVQMIAAIRDSGSSLTLTLDGKPLKVRRLHVKRSANPADRSAGQPAGRGKIALVATAKLSPGKHVIAVGSETTHVYVCPSNDRGDAPADWPKSRPHPPLSPSGKPTECQSCHQVKASDGGAVLGPVDELKVCFECHDLDTFKLVHTHRIESLAACRMCHDPHGGTTAALLIDKPKVLCAECHD